MGNNFIPLNQAAQTDRSKYSHISRKEDKQESLHSDSNSDLDSLWRDVTHQNIYYRSEYGKFQVYRNDFTLEEVEKYKIVLKDKNEFEKWKELLKWRNNCQQLCRVQHFVVKNVDEICVSQFQLNVFIQRIPLRLADLTDIPYPENLYFLLAVFKGIRHLFTYPFGLKVFNVTQSMICVNRQGEVKVWLNPNLSQNLPTDEKQNNHITEQQTLSTILDLIERNTDQRDYPYPFKTYLSDKNSAASPNFNWIIQQLNSYAKDMQISIPKYAFSVRDILSRDLLSGVQRLTENSLDPNKIQLTEQQPEEDQPIHSENINFQTNQQTKKNVSLNSIDFQNAFRNQQISFNNQAQNKFLPQEYKNIPPVRDINSLNEAAKINTLNSNESQKKWRGIYDGNEKLQNQHVNMRFSMPERTFCNIQTQLNKPSEVETQLDRPFLTQSQLNRPIVVNRFGSNIIQFRQPETINYLSNFSQYKSQNNQRAISASVHQSNGYQLSQPSSILQNKSQNYALPPIGFQFVQRKVFNSSNYLRNNPQTHPIQFFNHYPMHPTRQIPPQSQIVINENLKTIQRVKSCSIPINTMNNPYLSLSQNNHYKSSPRESETIRPESLSSKMKIERVNHQASQFLSSSRQGSNKNSASSKNSLIKLQDQEGVTQNQVSKLKYFTKKDSQETLDPQIALDLMKYLSEY